ncbi:hypothetical protein JB92DRAFT_2968863 [Gautieria morchelliformis]|nr:hypothetical protein JB92DRAFT_2968863 [Gautieria morchelliformis]
MFRIRPLFGLLVLSVFCLLVAADKNGGSRSDGGDRASETSSASASLSTASASAGNGTSVGNGTAGAQGDKQCLSQLMCITGSVSGSTVTYQLQSITSQTLGWMAIGFGSQMANTPMVIMWPNTDGTMTLSQRQASGLVMPTPVASPTNVATAATSLSTLSGSQPVLAFTIAGSASQVPLIWAFGTTRPSAAADSTLQQHLSSGTLTLDLTKTLSSVNGTTSSSSSSTNTPLLPYEKMIIAHAVVATFGFLFLLPGGVLLARYTRTISPKWYTGHWVIQAALAGPTVVAGIILGFKATDQAGISFTTKHQNVGIALLVLYFVQCFLGAFIHFVKIPFRFKRPPQNYGHAILGLTILALALYQVRLGYKQEWPNITGRTLSNGVNIVWIVWTVLLAVLYFGGLAYLPRQWRQERGSEDPRREYQMSSYEDSQEENLKLNRRPS